MHWIVLAGAYVILWFLALQILLPIGVSAQHESGGAVTGDPGAPAHHRLGLKLAVATLLAALVWGVFYALVVMKVVDV